ncbi:MAG: purine-nucleoside phosphorylase [Actinomycetota bacterium]|nr:purine-nucleoside phosphorylase [Actinomycetota bacterium]
MISLAEVTGGRRFRVAIVLGSGLSDLARRIADEGPVAFGDLEGLVPAGVPGHEGAVYWGDVEGVPALVFAGRLHFYEGHDVATVVAPVELAAASGCDTVVLTNAAGAIDPTMETGAPCLISDQINLTGVNPQRGPHDGRGPRFLDLSRIYDPGLRELARAVDPGLQEGIYAGVAGPTYETPAEIGMLGSIGADLVGMSTVLESIQARYLGMRVLGISVVTNAAAGLSPEPIDHAEVAAAGGAAADHLESILRGVCARLV